LVLLKSNPTEVKTNPGTDHLLRSYVPPFPPHEMTVITLSESRSPISRRLVSCNLLRFCPPVCYRCHFVGAKQGMNKAGQSPL